MYALLDFFGARFCRYYICMYVCIMNYINININIMIDIYIDIEVTNRMIITAILMYFLFSSLIFFTQIFIFSLCCLFFFSFSVNFRYLKLTVIMIVFTRRLVGKKKLLTKLHRM